MNPSERAALEVVRTLRTAGHEAYFVGGCVRDRLLGVESQDFDVTTDAEPDRIRELFPRSESVGESFGVMLVKSCDSGATETATYRLDRDYVDGRRPESVAFTKSAKEDVQRRDFTINGLLWDPIEARLVDYVGGQADLKAKLVRAIGDPEDRFREDRLRMLRAVRFAARLGFEIEPATLSAIRAQASAIGEIAVERVRDELTRILTEGGARRGFELLDETRLMNEILPEIDALKGVEQSPEHHPEGDVWTHTLIMLEGLPAGTSATLALGVLLHDVGKPATQEFAADRIRFNGHVEKGLEIAEKLLDRLRYSNKEKEQALALVGHHMRFMHVREMRESKLKRFLRMEGFDEHLALHRLDCSSSHGSLDNWEFMKAQQEVLAEEQLRPPRMVTGADLIAAGYDPGPDFKAILEAAEDWQLEGTVSSKDEAMERVAREFPR